MNDKIDELPPPLLGTRIRTLRKERGLTLSKLAQLADTSTPTMHRYESGWDRFEVSTLRRIANALDASLEIRLVPNRTSPRSAEPDAEEILRLVAPLFWDHKLEIQDLHRHQDWVLGRVLMFGSPTQVTAVRRYFGDSALSSAIRRREIDSRTRNYWELILEEPCTRES